MAEQLGEKTEEPTSKKFGDARQRGQIAKSADLAAFIVMAGATVSCLLLGGMIFREMTLVTRYILSEEIMGTDLGARRVAADLEGIGERIGFSLGLFMLVMALVGAIAQVTQVGFVFSSKALGFKPEKLDPIKGMGRLFSKKSVVKAALDIGKLVILGTVAGSIIAARWDVLMSVGVLGLMEAMRVSIDLMIELASWVLLAMLILGVFDLIYQRWQHKDDLKMTKQGVKEERKSSDGDMEMKQRRMRMAREIALQRLGADVPQADVVVTNPTHYSVALKYDQDSMEAPRVLAKGADYLALRIRQIATSSGIPIVERPPLARALYAKVAVGREINVEHFEAVAEVLAYVYKLDRKVASRSATPEGAAV